VETLSKLKKDLEFNKGLSSLIETLKTIAVSQYRTLERRLKSYKELLLTIESFFEFIDIKKINHPFVNPKNRQQAVVAITSDAGLLGGLNMQVLATAIAELRKSPGRLIVIGERGKIYAREFQIQFIGFGGIVDEERYSQAMQLRDYIISKISEGTFGPLKIVYPRPVSFTIQRVETVTFLPYSPPNIVKDFQRERGLDIIMESNPRSIMEYLIYLWIGQKLYEIFGLSRLAEFAARFVHLEESTQKLKDLDKKLRLQYFRIRHELIDCNMRELFAARLLYTQR
jgi:ATP synthase F1 gamma subunit